MSHYTILFTVMPLERRGLRVTRVLLNKSNFKVANGMVYYLFLSLKRNKIDVCRLPADHTYHIRIRLVWSVLGANYKPVYVAEATARVRMI